LQSAKESGSVVESKNMETYTKNRKGETKPVLYPATNIEIALDRGLVDYEFFHGTSNFGFDEFKGGYFTPNEGYAKTYMNTSASSIAKGADFYKTPKTGGVYRVQLDIKKPFDTRKPSVKKLWGEYINEASMSGPDTKLSRRGFPDWTEGENLKEWLAQKGYKFDGIVVDEGMAPGIDGKLIDRGVSVSPMDGKQVKIIEKRPEGYYNPAVQSKKS
jgi:hypothetical protein